MVTKKLWEGKDFEDLYNSLSKEEKLLRRKIRYACFRIQTYIINGHPKYDDSHQEIKDKIESLPDFEGWEKFGKTWDIATPDPIIIVKRKWSIEEEWLAILKHVVPVLPGLEHLEENNKSID